jgi:hypothetical protein
MTISFYKIFNLNINFSWDELENAYESVIERYDLNTSLNDIDKQIYKDQIDRYYREAKKELVNRERLTENNPSYGLYPMGLRNWMWDGYDFMDRMERKLNNKISNISSEINKMKNKHNTNLDNGHITSNNYFTSNHSSERRMSDGSLLVINNSTINENGKEIINTETYIISKEGVRKDIDINTAKLLLDK